MIRLSGRKLAVLPFPRARSSRPIDEPRDARPDFLRPDLQRVVAAGLDKLLEVPVADRVTVEEKGAHLGVGKTAVTEDNGDVPRRDQRHPLMQEIPGRPGVPVADRIGGVVEQDEGIAILGDQALRYAREPIAGPVLGRASHLPEVALTGGLGGEFASVTVGPRT
jgi:hypothetical protein